MSTLPLTQAILLEIHQSFGYQRYPTTKKTKFATGQISLKADKEMFTEILLDIFEALGMDPQAQFDALNNAMEFTHAYKSLELHTWTFAADQHQILWTMLAHFYVPALARRVGIWNLEQALDNGMPGGRFWYIPEPCEVDGKPGLYLPVAQVIDWLLDLLGMPLEAFADRQSEGAEDGYDGLRRSLYNWRSGTTIRPDTINKYFSDETDLHFDGAISLNSDSSSTAQFVSVLNFVKKKGLTADKLRLEIPMTQPGRIEAILAEQADEDERATFIKCIADRYAVPLQKTIRQRLLLARMVQDGYVRLLTFLFPNVDMQCVDPQKNKLLQLFAIYKLVYNLTIDAWRHCQHQGEAAKNAWFEAHLPEWDKHRLFLTILPSRRETANQELAELLTRYFSTVQPEEKLEDHVGFDRQSIQPIIQREMERLKAQAEEMQTVHQLIERTKVSSPWRALQTEHRYWVVSQVAQHSTFNPRARDAAIKRLRELAATPSEVTQATLLELEGYLNIEHKQRPKDTMTKVNALLNDAETNPGYDLWKAPILQYKAKHLLASNDFEGAKKLFREALNAAQERNYGTLRGEIARDGLAVEIANQKLIVNNHEKYYREMLAAGMMDECDAIPSIEETARWASNYFWDDLYKPYPGIEPEVRRVKDTMDKWVRELLPMFQIGNREGLQKWLNANRQLLKSSLPDVEGNSVLMALLKMHSQFQQNIPMMKQRLPLELQSEIPRFETLLAHWHAFIGQLTKACPKQLNIPDIKGQTPLMLVAETGDTALVTLMLEAGADPEMQSHKGMTALHSAIKSKVDGCVDALLDHPCHLNHLTDDGCSPLHTASWTANLHAVERLLQLAPNLAWQRDLQGNTPLERVEYYIENPEALRHLADELAQHGRRCATQQALVATAALLVKAAPVLQE
ncbi:ankyrin repeat domain-containing protein [Candidatus Symbiopectobacterium sp. NZEC127]|uniref:ankyrin repeat domain-containing protein n=1 Tax=Candidatus Symbiopectobacterium sp. NZEC127 TaxID=2820472 RepID=UPI002227480B|nr:ankyrin repeat domain-containing protein [Candidatus Symbiopectobacterium sp. NZEC127]MCW2486717.1 ankyrin repeat domain-containing protein [Candidatus Symbiopectobacterium sp. NZEC127]